MSYKDGEVLILELVQSLDAFNTDNAERGDWLMLNSGDSDHYAILRPGGSPISFITERNYLAQWSTIIEVWQSFDPGKSDSQNLDALEENVQQILDGIMPYRLLKDTNSVVSDARISNIGEALEMLNQDGGLEWIRQDVTVLWNEERAVTFEE